MEFSSSECSSKTSHGRGPLSLPDAEDSEAKRPWRVSDCACNASLPPPCNALHLNEASHSTFVSYALCANNSEASVHTATELI